MVMLPSFIAMYFLARIALSVVSTLIVPDMIFKESVLWIPSHTLDVTLRLPLPFITRSSLANIHASGFFFSASSYTKLVVAEITFSVPSTRVIRILSHCFS